MKLWFFNYRNANFSFECLQTKGGRLYRSLSVQVSAFDQSKPLKETRLFAEECLQQTAESNGIHSTDPVQRSVLVSRQLDQKDSTKWLNRTVRTARQNPLIEPFGWIARQNTSIKLFDRASRLNSSTELSTESFDRMTEQLDQNSSGIASVIEESVFPPETDRLFALSANPENLAASQWEEFSFARSQNRVRLIVTVASKAPHSFASWFGNSVTVTRNSCIDFISATIATSTITATSPITSTITVTIWHHVGA